MLPDVQNRSSEIAVALNRVGITDLQLPIFISEQSGSYQHTVAIFNVFVDLGAHLKGINMSRLPAAIHKYIDKPINQGALEDIAENIRIVSEAETCEIEVFFPYFIKKLSPVNKEPGLVPYDIVFNLIKTEEKSEFQFDVGVTATSLCPCSKELSSVNAHNQKCLINITCKPSGWVWIEDIIRIAETSASSEIYSVLKRPDEKFVTDQMYENPCFVEDIARNVYAQLVSRQDLEYFRVQVESDESIHKHKAVAIIEI
jgi:GTP cyclohydrolase IB